MKQHSLYRQKLLNNAKTALRYNLCLVAVLIFGGCATTARTPLAPEPAPEPALEPVIVPKVADPIIPTEPVSIEDIEPTGDRLYDLLQKAAVETHSLRVRALLDTAAHMLRHRFVAEPNTAAKWTAIMRFTLERYHAISSHVPIPPHAPAGNPAQCPSRIYSCRFVASSALSRNQNKSAGRASGYAH